MNTKRLKSGVSLMMVILLVFGYNVYATGDYTLEVPDYYQKISENVYKTDSYLINSDAVNVTFSITVADFSSNLGDPYGEKSIQSLLSVAEYSINEIDGAQFIEHRSHTITNITNNLYKSIEMLYTATLNGGKVYIKEYNVFTKDTRYQLLFIADDERYFLYGTSNDIFNGFVINNYEPYEAPEQNPAQVPISNS